LLFEKVWLEVLSEMSMVQWPGETWKTSADI
jgi:hypothetical protein